MRNFGWNNNSNSNWTRHGELVCEHWLPSWLEILHQKTTVHTSGARQWIGVEIIGVERREVGRSICVHFEFPHYWFTNCAWIHSSPRRCVSNDSSLLVQLLFGHWILVRYIFKIDLTKNPKQLLLRSHVPDQRLPHDFNGPDTMIFEFKPTSADEVIYSLINFETI